MSKSTIRRYRDDEKFPNAYKDGLGAWKIPLEDLLAAGLKPVDPSPPAVAPEPALSGPTERERELEGLLTIERTKREAAERIAAMAEQSVDDLRRALRMIEAAPVKHADPAPEQPLTKTY